MLIGSKCHSNKYILINSSYFNFCQMGSSEWGKSKGTLYIYDARSPWRLPGISTINTSTAYQYLFTVYLYIVYTFQVKASGFIINPDLPWIGASPDGMVTCTCHGDGVLEIKCPFNSRDRSLNESCRDSSFCLCIGEDGTMELKTDHKFMYQVQVQMHVSMVSYCDFIVWTPQEFFIQRIKYDPVFFHNAYLEVVEFIKTRVLPELLGKWYTAPRHTPTHTTTTEEPSEMGCYCGKPYLDNVRGSTFTSLALNWAGYRRHGNVWSAEENV